MQIKPIHSPKEIERCFEVFLELRPHLKSKEAFVAQVLQQQQEGYQMVAIFVEGENETVSGIGFRILTTLAWGKILYIDDLITKEHLHGKGYASNLIKYIIAKAKELDCDQLHLDSGYTRNKAHRFYLKHGLELTCHHFSLKLK